MRTVETTWRQFGAYPLEIGRMQENDVSRVIVDVAECLRKYPGAVFGVSVTNADGVSYSAEDVTLRDGLLTWTISDGDTAAHGAGSAQVVMYGDNREIARSAEARTIVRHSIVAEGDPPSAPPNWIDTINRFAGDLDGKVDSDELGSIGSGFFIVQDAGGRADKTPAEIREAVAKNMLCLLVDRNGIVHIYNGEGELESAYDGSIHSGLLFASTPYYRTETESSGDKKMGFWVRRMVVTETGEIFWTGELARTSNPGELILYTGPGTQPAVYDGSKTVVFEFPDDYIKEEKDPTVPDWAKEPEKPEYSAKEIGLGNVANERQYSAKNPPPYPVTSVNGRVGDVALEELFVVKADGMRLPETDGGQFIGSFADKTPEEIRAAVADGKTCIMVDAEGTLLPYVGEKDNGVEMTSKYPAFSRPGLIYTTHDRKWQIITMLVKENSKIETLFNKNVRLANPKPIAFTGAVSATYDGSESVIVNIPTGGTGGSVEYVTDEEVLGALAENDLMIAVGDDTGVLTDENNNVIEW